MLKFVGPALAPVMDPERDGYISLEEESTSSPHQCPDSPKEDVPYRPRPADGDAALSEGSTAELVEAGVPEEPCFYGHGPAWSNRHWRSWKPRDTPRMPPKGKVYQLRSSNQTACRLLPK